MSVVAQPVPSTSTTTSTSAAAGTSTPSKTSVGGQAYVRTKSGNLISVDLVKKREMEAKRKRLDNLVGIVKNVQQARSSNQRGKSTVAVVKKIKTLCQYFQKTGQCKKGLTCPYIHDSDKVSICPRYIKKSCPYPSSACPLSHEPNAHRMPQCQHFPYCTKGTDCPYNHVHVSPNAKVCKDFVTLGWCERGLECKERHVWECPEFSETGECNKRGCKYPHVIRRKTTSTTIPAADAALQDDPNKDTSVKMDQQPETQTAVQIPVASASVTLQRKRSYDAATASDRSDDDNDNDASSFIENAIINHTSGNNRTGVNGRKKKLPKIDAMEANDDFVTLVISESEEEEDNEQEEEDVDEVSDVDSADEEEPDAEGQERDKGAGGKGDSEVDEDGDDTLMIFDGPEVVDESAPAA